MRHHRETGKMIPTTNKFDLLAILKRRKVSVSRWLADEGIATFDKFREWVKVNSDKYLFSEDLDLEVMVALDEVVVKPAPLSSEVSANREKLAEEESDRRAYKKRKNAFHQMNTPVSGSSSEPDDVE